MKCKNCGGISFVKFASHYECVRCGFELRDEDFDIDSSSTRLEHTVTQKQDIDVYKKLLAYTDAASISDAELKDAADEIIENTRTDSVAECILAYLNRGEYPEKFKVAIDFLSYSNPEKEVERWICSFLAERVEYEFLDAVTDMMFCRGVYADYSQRITERKKEHEAKNANNDVADADIFICCCESDLAQAKLVANNLEAEGNTCVIAARDINDSGLSKSERIALTEEAIARCKIFVAIASKAAMESDDVLSSLDLADVFGIGKRIEYLIDGAENTYRFKRFFDGGSFIDASEGPQYNLLISQVSRILTAAQNPDGTDAEDENQTGYGTDNTGFVNIDDEDYFDDDEDVDENAPFDYPVEDDEETVTVPFNYPTEEETATIPFDYPTEEDENENECENENDLTQPIIETEIDFEAKALELFEDGEYERGFEILEKCKDKEFENLTNYFLGLCHENGYGTDVNLKEAERFYSLAENGAETGDKKNLGKCFYLLGMKYARGDFFEKNDTTAFNLFSKAAVYQNGNALYNLGICYKTGRGTAQDNNRAFAYFVNAATYIPEDANYQLGVCFEEGIGVAKNSEKSVEYYKIAAELGNIRAMTNLGIHYYYGDGIKQDYEQAVSWYRQAAEAGSAVAQYNMGRCYYGGTGVDQDMDFARDWFEKSAKNGNKKAAQFIAEHF